LNSEFPQPELPVAPAYLVLQSAGRWSDVFRLAGHDEAIIGRASANQIVIRSDQASRRHARIAAGQAGWTLEDLGSRNGTFVNGCRVEGRQLLRDQDVITVAGHAITFAHRIDGSSTAPDDHTASARKSAHATDDQVTMEIDFSSITDRRRRSTHLHSRVAPAEETSATSRRLLRLAFTLARAAEPIEAVERVLDSLAEQTDFATAGVYAWESLRPPQAVADIPLVATRQSGTRPYRRPPQSLLEWVGRSEGQAILARNVTGDRELASENSRGEIDVESVIMAPVRDHNERLLGFIHLTTLAEQPPLAATDLECVVASAEILAESLAGLLDRQQLNQSLVKTRRQVRHLQTQLTGKVQIIGNSDAIEKVIAQTGLVAPTNTTVLIRGESGVGKELVAAAIHHASPRREGPLVCLNCAALSPTLLESELFGHEKGAFTGATDRKRGKFELADGGTLMLDEIGEMSGEVQAKFLRVLEGHAFERVGGHESIRADVRVVAATNRDLQSMVRDGAFRQDLYYRLHVVEIFVPPLRHRGADVLLLANHFLARFNAEMGRKITGFTPAAKQALAGHPWPGNIRELKNVIERAVVLNTKTEVDQSDLLLSSTAIEQSRNVESSAEKFSSGELSSGELSLAELEKLHIERVLRQTGGNKSRAAAILAIERSTLDRKLKKYGGQ
jgi:Nif-specific regulatory protein